MASAVPLGQHISVGPAVVRPLAPAPVAPPKGAIAVPLGQHVTIGPAVVQPLAVAPIAATSR